uniref:Uncharacterized protein n=1 Tax=Desertifilum tharense IPPAS B-1220 TaxID=1781255 RepID=A0ACD5GN41_9CYAN
MKRHYLAGSFSLLALLASSAYWSASAVTFTPPPLIAHPVKRRAAHRGAICSFLPLPIARPVKQRAAHRGAICLRLLAITAHPVRRRAVHPGTCLPPTDNGAPNQATGGASRNLFAPRPITAHPIRRRAAHPGTCLRPLPITAHPIRRRAAHRVITCLRPLLITALPNEHRVVLPALARTT